MKNKALEQITDREFNGAEFKAGIKQGQFMFYGQTTKKDLKEHFKKAKEVFE